MVSCPAQAAVAAAAWPGSWQSEQLGVSASAGELWWWRLGFCGPVGWREGLGGDSGDHQ